MDSAGHWANIYSTRSPADVSWYEPTPVVSLGRVREAIANGARSLIDVGGGASTLVDHLVGLDLARLVVLDVSERALEIAKARLGRAAGRVEWVVADITGVGDLGSFDLWHDRAVLHFLTDRADCDRYVSLCERTVTPGGVAVVAAFAPDGPETCSGLPVRRYDASGLADRCGPRFELIDSRRYVHTTPTGVRQPFVYASFRRLAEDRVPVRT